MNSRDIWDENRRGRDLKLMLHPIDWPGAVFVSRTGGPVFCLKRWVEGKMEFANLEFYDGDFYLYDEGGKLLDQGGIKVCMQAIDNGWVAD
jgi:hypothetical protein